MAKYLEPVFSYEYCCIEAFVLRDNKYQKIMQSLPNNSIKNLQRTTGVSPWVSTLNKKKNSSPQLKDV